MEIQNNAYTLVEPTDLTMTMCFLTEYYSFI